MSARWRRDAPRRRSRLHFSRRVCGNIFQLWLRIRIAIGEREITIERSVSTESRTIRTFLRIRTACSEQRRGNDQWCSKAAGIFHHGNSSWSELIRGNEYANSEL